ncbi:MAG: GNAT family N-acetyltransferase, partial [Deltaproteobacteria bacterium]|nr:GNAT family N-acetyltransferase [Deltaproteobacteria bacterium]
IAAEPSEAMDFFNGAEISAGGATVFALPSRNLNGWTNIRLSLEEFPNQFPLRECVDMVVTEYGVAVLKGKTVRERAQALIDIAHPDDRQRLLERAKAEKILYQDQIFVEESAAVYPAHIAYRHGFEGGLNVRFRAIKPSDEEEMRRMFYRFSEESVYSRYLTSIRAMPHAKMQEYVNVDYRKTMSIVGLLGKPGEEHIIAEGRFVRYRNRPYADLGFIVDEEYQGKGIGTYLYELLIKVGKREGLQGFTADVLPSNRAMLRVFEKGSLPMQATFQYEVFRITIPFEQ